MDFILDMKSGKQSQKQEKIHHFNRVECQKVNSVFEWKTLIYKIITTYQFQFLGSNTLASSKDVVFLFLSLGSVLRFILLAECHSNFEIVRKKGHWMTSITALHSNERKHGLSEKKPTSIPICDGNLQVFTFKKRQDSNWIKR